MATQQARKRVPAVEILVEFRTLDVLWSGSNPPYPSEQSARWAVRMHRAALVESRALALSRGRVFVHPERFSSVIETQAIEAMRRRSSPPGETGS